MRSSLWRKNEKEMVMRKERKGESWRRKEGDRGEENRLWRRYFVAILLINRQK